MVCPGGFGGFALDWFKFENVNEATWKLTNGEMTNVPASHGQWGGYRTSKAIAWVINVAPSLLRSRKRWRWLRVLAATTW